jgi:hypothetical protein
LILANQLTRLFREVTGAPMEGTMKHHYAIGILFAALTCAGSAQLSAQDAIPSGWQLILIPDGETVYDALT